MINSWASTAARISNYNSKRNLSCWQKNFLIHKIYLISIYHQFFQVLISIFLFFFFKFLDAKKVDERVNVCKIKKKRRSVPLIAIQASFCLLWLASSDNVTTRGTPPTPVKSAPEFPKRIQSIRLWPGASAVLFRGLPANIQRKENHTLVCFVLKIRKVHKDLTTSVYLAAKIVQKFWERLVLFLVAHVCRKTQINCKIYHWCVKVYKMGVLILIRVNFISLTCTHCSSNDIHFLIYFCIRIYL